MLFADALDIHKSFTPAGARADILGDGFLMERNPVYRKVREQAGEIGCEWVEAYPEYLLLPFHELPRIVQTKRIPYVPSARLMHRVEEERPGVFATVDVPIPESYHLHEAAHVLADHHLQAIPASSREERILKSLLAESFANTVDALACGFAGDEMHEFFLKMNCYMQPQKKNIQAMTRVREALGFRFLFMLAFFSYLHANFLTSPMSKKRIDELRGQYAGGKKVGVKLQKDIQTVSSLGEKLDPIFRVTTTGNYLKQMGCDGLVEEILDFPFSKMFASRPELGRAVDVLCDSISG